MSPRNRTSAKKAGAHFERQIADTLAAHIDDRIDRRVKTGSSDKGDIGGLRHMGGRITVECKNTTRTSLAGWIAEAETERGNEDGLAALVIAKRHGRADPLDAYVHTTVRELIALLTGERPEEA